MTDRERFEAWAVSERFAVHRNGGEQYVNTATHDAWAGWQASRKQALEEASSLCFRHALAWADTTLGNPSHKDMARGAQSCMKSIDDLATPEGEQG